jgi:hypothetical protein
MPSVSDAGTTTKEANMTGYCPLCEDLDLSCICSLDDRKATMTKEEYRELALKELEEWVSKWRCYDE